MPGATMSDAAILGVLNAINHSAIAAGQLAKDRASSDEVQRYASRMAAAYSVKRPEFKRFLREVGPVLQRHLKAALSVQRLILSGE